MATFTEAQLDQLETALDEKDRPRARSREAGRMYLLMNEGDRSYEYVTQHISPKSDGQQPTGGRVAVYIREYLTALGLESEAPRRGRPGNGNGESKTTAFTPMTDFESQVNSVVERYRAEVDRIETQIAENREASESFDPEAYRAEVADEFKTQMAAIEAKLRAWEADEGGIATKSVEQFQKDLLKRADDTESKGNESLAFIRPQLNAAETTLEGLIQMREAAKSVVPADSEKEPAEKQ